MPTALETLLNAFTLVGVIVLSSSSPHLSTILALKKGFSICGLWMPWVLRGEGGYGQLLRVHKQVNKYLKSGTFIRLQNLTKLRQSTNYHLTEYHRLQIHRKSVLSFWMVLHVLRNNCRCLQWRLQHFTSGGRWVATSKHW